ncbi:MAG: Crp/Fnr family transcriptional regulator [Luteolibacter sp.]
MTDTDTIRTEALAQALQATSIFSGLGEAELRQIAGYCERQSLEKNAILFREGDAVIGFYIVISGCIEAYRINEAGKEQVIHLIHPGGSFAEPAVAGLPGYPAHTKALEPSEVVLVRSAPFLEHLQVNSELALRILASLSRHLHELVTTIDAYRLQNAERRLLHWLLQRVGPSTGPVIFELSIPKSVLASELGTRQETLSRLFGKLRKQGILKVEGRIITIVDPVALKAVFDENLFTHDLTDS